MGCVSQKPKNQGGPNQNPANLRGGNNPQGAGAPNPQLQASARVDASDRVGNSNLAQPAPSHDSPYVPLEHVKNPGPAHSGIRPESNANNPQVSRASDFEHKLNNEPRFGGNPVESDVRNSGYNAHENNPYTVGSSNHAGDVKISVMPPADDRHDQKESSVIKPQSHVANSNLQQERAPGESAYGHQNTGIQQTGSRIVDQPYNPQQEQRGPAQSGYRNDNSGIHYTGSRLVGDPSQSGLRQQGNSNVNINVSNQNPANSRIQQNQRKAEANIFGLMESVAQSRFVEKDQDVVPREGEFEVEGYLWNSGILKIEAS